MTPSLTDRRGRQRARHRAPVLVKNLQGRLADAMPFFGIQNQPDGDIGQIAGIEDPDGAAGIFERAAMPWLGVFAAMDMRTNRIVWRQHWPERCYSGSVTTAGGLVFVGRNDGRFTALDSSNGKLLWEFQTGAGVNAPPSVFEHDGRQYVAVQSGWGSDAAGSQRTVDGYFGNAETIVPQGGVVWVFALPE